MITTDLAGTFFTLTKVSFLTALLAGLPFVLYQIWAFVAPGLYEHEKRFAVPLMVSSVFFLLVGIGFAYLFVLPGSPGACRDAWDGILAQQLDYRHRPCNFVEIMPRLDEHLRRGASITA